MHIRFAISITAVALSLLSTVAYAQTAISPGALITESVNEAKLVTLAGNTPVKANAKSDRGLVSTSLPMNDLWLQLKRSPEQQAALDRYTEDLSDPDSPNYHRWLTAKEFGARFGLAQEDIVAVSTWLESHGLRVDGVAPNRTLISFSGTAGQINEAFKTTIHNLTVNGESRVSNMTDPKIPEALLPAVAGVVKLNNFMPHPLHTKPQARSFDSKQRPALTTSSGFEFLAPQDFATIYNLNPLFRAGYTGRGQTIVVLEDSNVFSIDDWTQFRKFFGLARPYGYATFKQTHPSTSAITCDDPGDNTDDFEAISDAQWASAAAPDANIVLASCANTFHFGGHIAMLNLLNGSHPPAIISISYGGSEREQGNAENSFINALYQQAAVEGVSVFVSTGDSGADNNTNDRQNDIATSGISVNGLGSTPYNVAVGGTDYQDTYLKDVGKYWNSTNTPFGGSAKSYVPEIPWNQSCASVLIADFVGFATTYGPNGLCNSSLAVQDGFLTIGAAGGGPSLIYAKPAWQNVLGNPQNGMRDLPDVSLFAAAGVWGHALVACYSAGGHPCVSGSFYYGGGTSFASPAMAGIQALVNSRTGEPAGNPAPVYYALAHGEYNSPGPAACDSSLGTGVSPACIFHDVTQGDIDVFCQGTIDCFTDGAPNGVLSVSSTQYKPAYRAHVGWDYATGLGTVNAYNLVMNWPASQSRTKSGQ